MNVHSSSAIVEMKQLDGKNYLFAREQAFDQVMFDRFAFEGGAARAISNAVEHFELVVTSEVVVESISLIRSR